MDNVFTNYFDRMLILETELQEAIYDAYYLINMSKKMKESNSILLYEQIQFSQLKKEDFLNQLNESHDELVSGVGAFIHTMKLTYERLETVLKVLE